MLEKVGMEEKEAVLRIFIKRASVLFKVEVNTREMQRVPRLCA